MKFIANYTILGVILACGLGPDSSEAATFKVPHTWEYSPPLIAPEVRESNLSRAQKDPSVVFYQGEWHIFMTIKLKNATRLEYISFKRWDVITIVVPSS